MEELTTRSRSRHARAKDDTRCPHCGAEKTVVNRGHVYALIVCATLIVMTIIGAVHH